MEFSGDYTEEVTPVPISNTEVKLFEVDGTIVARLWESRTLPDLFLVAAQFIFRYKLCRPSQTKLILNQSNVFLVLTSRFQSQSVHFSIKSFSTKGFTMMKRIILAVGWLTILCSISQAAVVGWSS